MNNELEKLAAQHSSFAQIIISDQGTVAWKNLAFLSCFGDLPEVPAELLELINNPIYSQSGNHSEILDSGLTAHIKSLRSAKEVLHLIEVIPPSFITKQALSESLKQGIIDIDPLTGVLGRAGLEREIERWLAMSSQRPFALLFLDLDGFKQINDHHGHLEGDDCLRRVSNNIVDTLRTGDVIGRFGGDEFVLLITGISCDHEVQAIVDRIKYSVAKTNLPDAELPLSASIGWAFSRSDVSPLDLLKEADRAMYANKGTIISESTD